jgi:hypothetical protein
MKKYLLIAACISLINISTNAFAKCSHTNNYCSETCTCPIDGRTQGTLTNCTMDGDEWDTYNCDCTDRYGYCGTIQK